ncbi:MAG: hypothetical protein ACRBBU_02125 [Pseudooceanicola sp.]
MLLKRNGIWGKTMLGLGALCLVAACQTTTTAPASRTTAAAQCSVVNEAAFQRAASQLRAAMLTKDSNRSKKIEFSRCGYFQVTFKGGFTLRSPYSALYAKVGSPKWYVAISSRAKTERKSSLSGFKPSRYPTESLIEFPTPSRKTASRADLARFNGLLNTLAQSATGQRTSGVNVEQEMQGIAALDRASARIRGAAVGAATIIANAPAGGGGGTGSASAGASGSSAPQQAKQQGNASGGGYRIFETIPYSASQTVVARGKCTNGKSFNVRHYPNNGKSARFAIYNLSRSSIADVATAFCK